MMRGWRRNWKNMDYPPLSASHRQRALDRFVSSISRRWLEIFGIVLGLLVLMPFLAPLLMQLELSGPARIIYFIYSFLCHQLPERSFFLFGPQTMYTMQELQGAGADFTHMFTLRKFIGSPELGWKVAWSDRMVWMYSSLLATGLLWRPLLSKIKVLPWWGLVLFLLPMAVDGASHFISDLAGIGQGFRASNAWLAHLTGYALSPSFYSGDAIGSFNFIARLISGILFGLGVTWFAFPYLEEVATGKRD